MQPPTLILPQAECLQQAEMSKKKEVPPEVSKYMADKARKEAQGMTKEQRVDRARKGAAARWKKKKRR